MSAILLAASGTFVSSTPPTFGAAGTGGTEAPVSGTLQVPYPAGISSGDFLLAHVTASDAGGGSVTVPAGWTLAKGQLSTDTLVDHRSFYKIATGSESGNLDVTCSGANYAAGRMYRFTGAAGIEATGSATTDSSGTGVSAVNVTTLGANRLAIQLFFAQVNTTIGNISGESGADYTEAVAEFASATGPVIFSCQAATVTTAASITGGSATLGAAGTYRIRIGFALTPP